MIETRNRLTISKDWIGKNVKVRFPFDDVMVEIPHDRLVDIVSVSANYLNIYSWQVNGAYSIGHPNATVRRRLKEWIIEHPA